MTDVDSANLATGHEMVAGVQTPRGYPYNRRHAGSSTMHSGVDDMLRYGVMHANRGSIDGKRILKRETYNLLWKTEFDLSQRRAPRIALSRATSSRPMTKVSMGLGWFVYDFSGERVVNHDGGDRGFRSSLWIAPDRGVVAVVFANAGANAPELALSLLELALGIRPLPPPKTVELTAAERAKYVGVYALPSGPNSLDMTIFEQNGGLFVRVQGQNARPLAAYGNDTFGSSFDPTLRLVHHRKWQGDEGGADTGWAALRGAAEVVSSRRESRSPGRGAPAISRTAP
jgi:CubicO group peptidase (beta-lactamase class C family)